MIKRFIYSFHRILGTCLSILFLMWFLTGFVMMYHSFPKLTEKDRYAHRQSLILPEHLSETDSLIWQKQAENTPTLLILDSYFGKTRLRINGEDSTHQLVLTSEGWKQQQPPSFSEIRKYAQHWDASSPIVRVDTLHDLEQWIPFSKLRADLPVYKFYFKDSHQLYVSSVTGESLQWTDRNSRFWSYMGAIPHWVYFSRLRQDAGLWKTVVITLSGAGSLMCLAGILLGLRSTGIIRKRKKKGLTPYKKTGYRWHHYSGLSFGLFVFSFVFSGMMSMTNVPTIFVNIHHPERSDALKRSSLHGLTFRTDYRLITEKYPNRIKELQFASLGGLPVYRAIINDSLQVFDASTEKLTPLHLSRKDIYSITASDSSSARIDTLRSYDNYYGKIGKKLPLPVLKVSVKDADKSVYYINPYSGETNYYNRNDRVSHWCYQVLHRFAFGFLVEHNTIRLALLWVALLGGTFASLTGVYLSIRYLRRKAKKTARIG